MIIVVDTREQRPLPISKAKVKTVELWPGDYSITAWSRMFAVERKSVNDLVQTMKTGYAGFNATTPKRFDRELLGLGGIIRLGGTAFILVEPDEFWRGDAESEIDRHGYRSALPPICLKAFVRTIRDGYKIPVRMANSREHATQIVEYAAAAALTIKKAKSEMRNALKMSISKENDQ